MLTIQNLSFYFGERALYDEASLQVRDRDRIALIGANGTGKSTLLRLITGEYTPDSGVISKSRDCTLGFLNQDHLSLDSSLSIIEVALQAFEEQNALQKEMDSLISKLENSYSEQDAHRLSDVQARFSEIGGYTMQPQAEAVLEGLGFKTADLTRSLSEFSGGWRMRVILARLLLGKPSLLLLDEPTNHLDLPSIEWLESYISTYEGAVMIVSHDQYFLDACTNITVEVSGRKLNYYPGNYSFYVKEKELRMEIQKGAFENQQKKIKDTEKFIERFRSKATKARQVQSRVKALEKMDIIDDLQDDIPQMHLNFSFDVQPGKIIAELKNLSKAYIPTQPILKEAEALIMRGDKIALIGANGKGKSTLLRILAQTENFEGAYKFGHNVHMSFYAQHQLESLNLQHTILEELMFAGSDKTESEIRTLLGCFLFTGDDVYKKIAVLSGGEKSRVALAKTLLSRSNFLMLDEPTNHLDMFSVEVLMEAMGQYEGTFVVVSHNRHFISGVANKIWYIEDQLIKEYPGTYDEYLLFKEKQAEKEKSSLQAKKEKDVQTAKTKDSRDTVDQVARKQFQKDLKKIRQKIEEVEGKISSQENLIKQIESQLADPELYTQEVLMKKTQAAYDLCKKELAQLQDQWEVLFLDAEELEQKIG